MFHILFIEDNTPDSKRFLERIQQLPLQLNIYKVPGPRRAWYFIDARIHIDLIVAPSSLTDVDLVELIYFERDRNAHAQLALFGSVVDTQRIKRLSAAAFFNINEQSDQLLDKLNGILTAQNLQLPEPDPAIPRVTQRWDPAISTILHIQCTPTYEQVVQTVKILDQYTWQHQFSIHYHCQRYSLQLHKEDGVPAQNELITIATQIQSELSNIGLSPCFFLFSQPIYNQTQCNNNYALMDYAMDYMLTCDMRIAFMTNELLSQFIAASRIELPERELLQAIHMHQKEKALNITYHLQQKLHEAPVVPLPQLRELACTCLLSICDHLRQQSSSELLADLAVVRRLDQWQIIFTYLKKWLDRLSITPPSDQQSSAKKHTVSQILNIIENTALANLSVESIAEDLSRSPTYLNNVFKAEMQISLVKYIHQYRLTRAAELIRSSNRKIIDIAKDVGFDNYSYFCHVFRNYFSVTPSKYRFLKIDAPTSSEESLF